MESDYAVNPFLFLEMLPRAPGYSGQIVHVHDIPAAEARFAEPSAPISEELRKRLENLGITRLYTHQAQALDHVRRRQSIVVVTRTASGKTLCYNLPVLERMWEHSCATALYLFPTKALAQDQLGKLEQFHLPRTITVGAYDGDTPTPDRSHLRQRGRIILSNVDMLHRGILPRHTEWGRFLRRLEYVVVDELHVYRGVFGSHVGCLMRRLRRLCRHYGSEPVFIFSSATVANPAEVALNLSGIETQVIDDDGAPRGPRKFVFWNPPIIGNDGERRSSHSEATYLFGRLVEQGIRNITFTKARKSAEIILRYTREQLAKQDPSLASSIMSYRAGYRAEQRREIEQGLFSGKLVGVVGTEALELGVDIGGLDATVLTGYPGTISAAWQQAGRAGRGSGEAISFLIGLSDPLDQYILTHPDYFFARSHEQVLTNPANPYILSQHIRCAAHELPLTKDDLGEMGEGAEALAWSLCADDLLGFREGRFYWLPSDYPAADVNIRSSSSSVFRIVTDRNEVIGTVEDGRAYRELHEGAVYLHAGESYRVRSLDLAMKEARVEKGEFDYYTQPADDVNLRIVETDETYPLGAAQTYSGVVEVTTRVLSYRRKELFTERILGVEPLELPQQTMETDGVWWTMPHELVRRLEDDGFHLMGSIHAIEHAAISLVPLLASCDRWDVGGISHPYHMDTGGLSTIFIYDGHPGGVGIARACYAELKRLLTDTLELLLNCPCDAGCPSCIQSPKCGSNNEPLDKGGALRMLGLILAGSGSVTPS